MNEELRLRMPRADWEQLQQAERDVKDARRALNKALSRAAGLRREVSQRATLTTT